MKRAQIIIAAALSVAFTAWPAAAASTVIYAPVLGGLAALSPTGGTLPGGFATYGDVSHVQPRQLVAVVEGGTALAITREGGETARVFADPALRISSARWSNDDARIALAARGVGTGPQGQDEAGIWVATPMRDTHGVVTSVSDVRRAVTLPAETMDVSWSPDGRTVTYALNAAAPGARQAYDLYTADVDSGAITRLTNTPTTNEFDPAFAPVGQRIAFTVASSKSGPVRTDIHVMNLADGRTAQVTNKNNANAAQITGPEWSPDGLRIAFMGYPLGLSQPSDVFTIRGDGRDKAVSVTAHSADAFGPPQWRP